MCMFLQFCSSNYCIIKEPVLLLREINVIELIFEDFLIITSPKNNSSDGGKSIKY